ncbi:MAG: ester cyclase [Thermoplasmata archaeon]
MSVEENLQTIKDGYEAFNAHDWDRFLERYAESVVYSAPDLPEPLKGVEAFRELIQTYNTAFPDQRFEEVRTFGQGDWAVSEAVFTGTNKGPFPGPEGQTIPATNKQVRNRAVYVFKFEGGKVTELRGYADQLGLMAQLGLAPE